MSVTLLVSAWLVGALGGVHCVAMCGGFLGALAARDAARVAAIRMRGVAARQFLYHAGRVTTYALLGASFGLAGSMTIRAIDLAWVQRALYVAADVLVLLLAASLVTRVTAVGALQRAGAAAFAPLLRRAQPMLRLPGSPGRIAIGLVWGLMPCGLVYSVLPLALLAGGAWQGALVMAAFGTGTLPSLVAGGVALTRLRAIAPAAVARYAGAAIMVGFGSFGLWRVFAAPATLAALPFCVVP
jgi:sulfite exporter TauE/SafE